ncbi:DUF6538 domain-containing protein [Cohaesibacter marisflavi]|uniref:DUF6538 domain-containing protein n=1 Tax=Cohaesibacter marisflavi TaxID=655353 RepID=UPI0029C860A5|nr:DUF6538 domain-containing protein [Cohaesibacter marisflavi]
MEREDRFLQQRGKRWYYVRRVPIDLASHYSAKYIRKRLKTSDLAEARIRRDAMERADDALWADMRTDGQTTDTASRRYEQAINRALALSYKYVPASELATGGDISDILRRVEDLPAGEGYSKANADALLGRISKPDVSLSDAFKVLRNEIRAAELARKDKEGKEDWIKLKQMSIDLFVDVCGDIPIGAISREDGRTFFNYWKDRVLGKSGTKITGKYANRHIGNLRSLLKDYWAHVGEDHQNPFDGFSFGEKQKGKRVPLRVEQIETLFLMPGAFQKMNREARLITYMMIETGARMSELATLEAEDFRLEGDYPHVMIFEREGRAVKTDHSNRILPLVGISLAAAKIAEKAGGFPHYRPRRKGLSTTLNKFCRENHFFDDGQSMYSIRHTFEDRMKEADTDVEMRKYLMGHDIDREEYGSFASLKKKWEAVKKIELPFDPATIKDIC